MNAGKNSVPYHLTLLGTADLRADVPHVVRQVNWTAVEGYRGILRLAKEKYGLRTMLTLFHHSFPKWGIPWGGWTSAKAIGYFAELAE